MLEHMTHRMTDYLLGESDNLDDIPKLIMQIADTEEKAFLNMLNGATRN